MSTSGAPAAVKVPSPVPSGSRLLCRARLSGASSNQKVARTRRGAADIPNNRHMPVGYPVRAAPKGAAAGNSRAVRNYPAYAATGIPSPAPGTRNSAPDSGWRRRSASTAEVVM
ncbi:hypothetical protein GCM10023222_22890 [Saccharopolyspora cebuensis]